MTNKTKLISLILYTKKVLRRRDMKEMTEKWFLENFTFPVKDYYIKLGFDFEKEPFSISGSEF
ncbi:MAG: hypothetical protein HOL09_00675, partial [Candidatus Marinimicrobia bacterium]|nr:hypothetical protein [Candidatus Neomarinimicrobiota bacterium]